MQEIQKLAPEAFPALLLEIPDAPHSLYMRGSLPTKDTLFLAVVGSRKMSTYGKDACERIIAGLAGYPLSIVSGLAHGIDGVAHRAALNAGLHTVAIPGSGLNDDVLYPRAHYALARDILSAGGALISEEEPDFQARPESFPKRNRIMAGMSRATLVVEATTRSGTLITARLATDYNRDVLTIPGSVFSENTAGPHLLMKLGATPVREAGDVLEALSLEPATTARTYTLSESEKSVLEKLTEPLPRDELIRILQAPVSETNALLLEMELKGLITETLGLIRKNR